MFKYNHIDIYHCTRNCIVLLFSYFCVIRWIICTFHMTVCMV
uniref:Uncharacterized protein n=1 Tax=Anguilla anguilla TaxID=7936 RepID=A0A0E9P7D9_ANGAN